jgi:hypothetical protein
MTYRPQIRQGLAAERAAGLLVSRELRGLAHGPVVDQVALGLEGDPVDRREGRVRDDAREAVGAEGAGAVLGDDVDLALAGGGDASCLHQRLTNTSGVTAPRGLSP